MQAPQSSPSLASSPAQITSEKLTSERPGNKNIAVTVGSEPFQRKKAVIKPGGLTGAAAIASASVVLPLVAEGAAAAPPIEIGNVTASSAQSTPRAQSIALGQGKGVLPQIPDASRASFSTTPVARTHSNTFTTRSNDLIRQDADGNWTLAYATTPGQQTQAVVGQLASETAQATASRTCVGNDCRRLAYISRQLPIAQQRLEEAKLALKKFSQENTQSSLPAYKKVLSDRIGEISKQKSQLINDIAETRSYMGQLRLRLSTVNADLGLPERLLESDVSYQSTWAELQNSEAKLLEEYSKVNIDGTALNQVYAEYRSQQQKLEQAANKALSSDLLDDSTPAPTIMYEAPAALDVLQALVVATHQEKVQLLRDRTIAELEERLRDRQQTFARNISTYERLQRELGTAQASVDQYIEEREQIIANAGAVDLAQQGNSNSSFIEAPISDDKLKEASFLAARLPDGTVAKTLMGIVVAAGCIAAVVHKRKKKPAMQRLTPNWQQTANAQSVQVPLFAGQGQSSKRATRAAGNESLLQELTELVEGSEPVVPIGSDDIDVSIAIMARELDLALNPPQAPAPVAAERQFASEITNRTLDSVKLSLKDIDLFAEKAIQWVLQDITQGAITAAPDQTSFYDTASLSQMAVADAVDHRYTASLSAAQAANPQFAANHNQYKLRAMTQLKSA